MTYTREEIIENRKKWAADLRSNRYSQCRGTICDGVGYCCLGVAAVGLGREVTIQQPEEQSAHYLAVGYAMDLRHDHPFVYANDHLKYDFLRIADMVDALPPPEVP